MSAASADAPDATRVVVIPPRFCGPSDRGNGGYTCGLLARALDPLGDRAGVVEATLRRPAPLGHPLVVHTGADGHAELLDGDALVAQARPVAALALDVPDPVSLEEARRATARSDRLGPGVAFERCFSCGPDRDPDDALRILAGPVAGRSVYAAPWTPRAEFADERGEVAVEILWAGVDCAQRAPFEGPAWGAAVLGRMALEVLAPVPVERDYVVMSWRLGVDGRKGFAADALLDADGAVHAVARSTWIRPPDGTVDRAGDGSA